MIVNDMEESRHHLFEGFLHLHGGIEKIHKKTLVKTTSLQAES